MKKLLHLTFIFLLVTLASYAQVGFTCANAIPITTLPYSTTDDTANYGDTTDVTQPIGCANTVVSNFMTGNDVFYSYTPIANGAISIKMTPNTTWSGVFVYDGCPNVGVACSAGVANDGNGVRTIPSLAVIAGHQYIIVISTNADPQTVGYTLVIQSLSCTPPSNLGATNITSNSAQLSWGNPSGASSWEVAVQTAGSPIPSGSGVTSTVNSGYIVNNLAMGINYQYYVRADCGNGTFSAWAGPHLFNIPPCNSNQQCYYNIVMTDSYGDGWTGAAIQIRQNSYIVAMLTGPTSVNGTSPLTVAVPLCDNTPFDIYWSNTNSHSSEIGFSVVNSFGQTIFTRTSGTTPTLGTVAYSGVANCSTMQCIQPTVLSASNITNTSASLSWTENNAATSWEVMVQAAGLPAPTGTGIIANTNTNFVVSNLNPGSNYDYYVRSSCSTSDSSPWAGPYTFNTYFCNATQQCNYTFEMSDSFGDGWNGGSLQVRQNGLVFATLTGPTEANGTNPITVSVPLCDGLPFDLYWSNPGYSSEIKIVVRNSFGQTLYTKNLGTYATMGTIAYSGAVNCSVPVCFKPTGLSANNITNTSATLSWTENNTATSWEVMVQAAGLPLPSGSGTIANSNTAFTVSNLNPGTNYDYYVRSLCSNSSSWAGPYTFGTYFCDAAQQCIYTFEMSDSAGDGWNGGIIQVRQNGLVVATLTGPTAANGTNPITVTVPLCDGLPFDLYWSNPGSHSSEIQVVVRNSFGQPLFTRNSGIIGGIGTIIYTSTVNCSTMICNSPTTLSSSANSSTSVTLGWTENNSSSSWEVIAVPLGATAPTESTTGQTATTNPTIITGLNPDSFYTFYVRSLCSATDKSSWSSGFISNTIFSNDDCANAIAVPVNYNSCSQIRLGCLDGATPSPSSMPAACLGAAVNDVWFQFVATNYSVNISLRNITGSSTNLTFALYSGNCNTLNQVYCSTNNHSNALINNLTIGTTYYIRVYSNGNTPQTTFFNICVSTPSTCVSAESICGVNNYANSTGISSLGTIGCLTTTPNPSFFTIKISQSGPVNLLLTQATLASTNPNLDVDYAAWGPFASQSDACAAIGNNSLAPGIGVPVTQLTGCSYSAAATETLNIANAQAGQYYIMLITNYSNQPGYINVIQTNNGVVGAGYIDCSGIRLNAFLDSNANGTQDNGEPNFSLGQFHYDVNNSGTIHNIISPSGTYNIYDYNLTNQYNLSYSINSEYSAMYASTVNFSNVNVSTGSMITYNFPITSIQNYDDIGVSIVPLNSPRAGNSYKVKVVYSNNGTQTIPSGTLTFTNNVNTSITNATVTGTTATPNGFTYPFTNLLPYESRTFIVTLTVATIPNVYIGQLLTTTVAVTPPTGDLLANNNSNAVTQAVIGSYDPNDKVEGHGEEILYSTFTPSDYLEYTIRFENNGTAGALNILVNDTLDSKLDENTLVMLDASHNYTLERLDNMLTWNFHNIQLPVSIPDTDIGKGFVKFKIKPKPGYAVGDIIPNTADIYFDSNPAIVTNTFNTKFVTTLSNNTFVDTNITLFPNPATNSIQINVQNSAETIEKIEIYDVLGKKVSSNSNIGSSQAIVDVSALAKGLYLVEITSESHLKLVKKLIIK